MLAAVLFITGIFTGTYTAVGFNIYTTPVSNFTYKDPLFGQTIIQSKNGVFVPSPTSGDVFRCTKETCSAISVTVTGVKKGLRLISSAASRWREDDKEQLLVCNQVRTKYSSNEHFNGNCTHMYDEQEKSEIYPDQLVLQILGGNGSSSNNNNNNNNKYQDSPKSHQDHWRKRRAVQDDTNTDEDEEDEDAGTEIAFVLDGSGSIDLEDFKRAKNFISTVMNNVWKTCFSCNFAIAQFGRDIRTELSLQENNDTLKALDKVKNIRQVKEVTKTASALYHVLTEIFVPENGSKKNAKKIIIVLSDGEMLGDTRSLSDVLNMTQMEGIVRYAIGVGKEVFKPKMVEEMTKIAGNKDRFFNVSNYAALEQILSSLEKSIIGIEGLQKGAGFEFQLAEAGFSSHFTHDGSILFGAVGAYDWSGGIILKKSNKDPVAFLNATKEDPRFSYLGYSVASAYENSKTLYISGAPRYNLTGAVFIFDGTHQDLLQGDQVGSYFGSVLCALDSNDDKVTDYLLVGAPHFHVKREEGKVLVYKLNQGKFEKEATALRGLQTYEFARFGSAIADIGDIDGNGFRDVAVGAPFEEDTAGSVYIYNVFKDGIEEHFSQRITPSDFGMKLEHFGQAVSGMSFSEKNNQPLISVGSKGTITVFETIPVIIIKPKITIKPKMIDLDKQTNDGSSKFDTRLQICFNSPKGEMKSGNLPLDYNIDLDSGKEQKRLVYTKPREDRMSFTLTESQTCTGWIDLKYVGCTDCFSPIKIRVNFTLAPSLGKPVRLLDAYSPKEAIEEIEFEKECSSQQCEAILSLNDSKLSNDTVTIGLGQTLDIKFNLTNYGDNSYMTTLTLNYPEILSFKKSEGGTCEDKHDKREIVCKLLHPIFKKNRQANVNIAWQTSNSNTNGTASITALLTGGKNGSQTLDSKTYDLKVKKALPVQLSVSAKPNSLNITEGEESKKQMLHFNFKLSGENKYNAKINVTITIENKTKQTDIVITKVEPKTCSYPVEGNMKVPVLNKGTYQIVCTLTELREIDIMAQVHIHDIQGDTEKIIAKGEITFDESIYDGANIKIEHKEVEVLLFKITVVKKTAYIVGSAIGGFVLLIIIIIILVKCGFFRRRHKMDRKPSTN